MTDLALTLNELQDENSPVGNLCDVLLAARAAIEELHNPESDADLGALLRKAAEDLEAAREKIAA